MTPTQLNRIAKRTMLTSMFSRTLAWAGIPLKCWAAVVFYYWCTSDSIPRLDEDRLKEDIRTGRIAKRPGIGKLRTRLLEEWFHCRNRPQGCEQTTTRVAT